MATAEAFMTAASALFVAPADRRACRKVCQQTKKRADWRGFQSGFPSEGPTPSSPVHRRFQTLRQAPVEACRKAAWDEAAKLGGREIKAVSAGPERVGTKGQV